MRKKFLGLLLILCIVINLFPILSLQVNADAVVPGVGDTVTFIDADWMCISVDTDDSDGFTGYKLLRNDPLAMVNFDEDSISFADSDIYHLLNSNYITSPSIFPGERTSIMLASWFYGTVADDDAVNMEANIGLLTLTEYNAIKAEDWYVPAGENEKWWLSTSESGNICTAVYSGGMNNHTLTSPNTSDIWVRPSLWLNTNTDITSFVLTDGKYVATYPFTTPGINPAGGTVTFPRDITISDYGADHVYYTTDGTTPASSTTGSTLEYTGPITITSNMTIKAISTKAGYFPSSVATASYTQAASALTGLVLSGTPTGFTFTQGTLTYNGVKVANDISSITVTPTGTGTITVNGTEVASGTASTAISLTAGQEESISVIVSQTGKSSTTYTINITRRSNIWDGVTTEEFTGSGLEADPYIINTAEKLAYLAAQVNLRQTYSGKYFEMTADIMLNDTTGWQTWYEETTGLNEWTPIGNNIDSGHIFNGVFDGGGFAVRGVFINGNTLDNRGLFGFVDSSGIVRNLGVTQSYISGDEYVGGVVGRINNGIEYCWFSGTVEGNRYVGGVGGCIDGTAQYCFNTGTVSGTLGVGGLFGIIGESSINKCYNAGAVSGGYLVGGITSTQMENITDCYNSGVVTGLSIPALDAELPSDTPSPLYIGAIVGEASYPGQITGCFYDKQMSREAGIGGQSESDDIAGTVGKRTVQMSDYMFRFEFGTIGDWVIDNGLYPRLTGMDTTDAALVSAMPVRLQFTSDTVFETSKAVKNDFIVGALPGFGWTSSNNTVISINDGIAHLTRQSVDTTLILTATKNNVSKQVPLNILAAPAAISPISRNYDLNAPADVTTAITWNAASSVTDITYEAASLATPSDYSISGNTLTIESSFIAGLSPALNDMFNLIITFNTGDTTTLTINTINSDSGGSGSTPPPPRRTITVTEASSVVFIDTSGTITAEANMDNAFSNSVEVKVTDTAEDTASFRLSAGDEVYPFDISLYIKGTNTKTEPADGYAVTISLPIPENLVEKRTSLLVAHKSGDGTVTTLNSRLVQKGSMWYLVFEATEFSPYALVVKNSKSFDESAGVFDKSTGVPYYMDAKGSKVFIGFAANGKYIAPEGVTVSMMQNGKSFADITGHWALPYIGFTTERELFLGTGGNKFSPELGMTRVMFTAVIGRLFERSFGGIESSDTHAFIDCDYGSYYGKYVDWADKNEIIMGIGSGKFAPDTLITREQMAAILYRFADFLSVLPDSMDASFKYPDAASISSYAKDAALYCQTTGIIGGRTVGVFAPQETATRAEVATIIQRFIEAVIK